MADVLADGRATLDEVILPTETPGIDVAPATSTSRATEGELFTALGREQVLREALDGGSIALRLRPHRLPAEPRAADRQRARRRRRRDHPGPDAVLRDEGPQQPRQGHQRDPAQAQPRPADPRPAADVLRRPDNLARDMLDELRVVGDHHVFDSIVRNTVKLGEAPLVGRPITSYASVGGGPHVPRARAGGDRTWPGLTSARPPRAACPRSASSPPPSSACFSPERVGATVGVRNIPVDRSSPTPSSRAWPSTRTTLEELAASIREHGVLQPILVRPLGRRPLPADRGRAPLARVEARRASATIPALVEEIDDDTALEIAIIENLQREDLSPLDEAAMYDRMSATTATASASSPRSWARTRATSRTACAGRRAARGPRAGVFAQRHPVPRLRAAEGRGRWSSSASGSRAGRPRVAADEDRSASYVGAGRTSARRRGPGGLGHRQRAGPLHGDDSLVEAKPSSTTRSRTCSASSATRRSSTRSAPSTGPTSRST